MRATNGDKAPGIIGGIGARARLLEIVDTSSIASTMRSEVKR